MSFRTQFERIRVNSNPGTQYEITYKPHYTDTGAFDLIESGKIDVYEQIQSFKESCDLKTILARFANGDPQALNAKLPYFGDFSQMPDTLAGYLQLFSDAETSFAALSPDIRSAFNNSPSEFFASIGTDKFNKLMGIGVPVSSDVEPVPENKEVSAE